MSKKIRVLIVDDSAIVRKLLTDALSAEPDIEVVGVAPDPYVARDRILELKPDVLTLDIEMPRMDGLSFLKRLMRFCPMPVIIISSLSQASSAIALEALQAGAVEALGKPDGPYSVGELRQALAMKIRAAAAAKIRVPAAEPEPVAEPKSAIATASVRETRPVAALVNRPAPQPATNRSYVGRVSMIALGASTGGTEALAHVLTQMPAAVPPIVVVQHIPPVFSKAFAMRLNSVCALEVKEAEPGDALQPGRVLIAPGGYHMMVRRRPTGYTVELSNTMEPVCYQRPAVDVLFQSVAEAAGKTALGAILTGMGADGAKGIEAMKKAGARTIAQDEASCVVFGMPREAIKTGCIDSVLPLGRVAEGLLNWC